MNPLLPRSVTLIRHGESAHNILAAQKEHEPVFQKFVRSYAKNMTSRRTKDLAKKVQKLFPREWGEHNIPLTEEGIRQSRITGQKLGVMIPPPDIIFCSPYKRTRETLEQMIDGWPKNGYVASPRSYLPEGSPGYKEVQHSSEISDVKIIYDPLLREQEHGLGIVFNDWRAFQSFMPEQKTYRELKNPYWYKYPQGESIVSVQQRLDIFDLKYASLCAGKDVFIIAHHRTILSYRMNKEGLSDEDYLRIEEAEAPVNCGVTIFRNTGEKLELEHYNKCLW